MQPLRGWNRLQGSRRSRWGRKDEPRRRRPLDRPAVAAYVGAGRADANRLACLGRCLARPIAPVPDARRSASGLMGFSGRWFPTGGFLLQEIEDFRTFLSGSPRAERAQFLPFFGTHGQLCADLGSPHDLSKTVGWTAPRHHHVPELGHKQPRLEPSMTQYKRIGIDTSKAVFTLHGIDSRTGRCYESISAARKCRRSSESSLPRSIALGACGGSHYWARELTALGHTVRLIPPQYVKPYVKRGKNDRNDAEAICEAAGVRGCISCR